MTLLLNLKNFFFSSDSVDLLLPLVAGLLSPIPPESPMGPQVPPGAVIEVSTSTSETLVFPMGTPQVSRNRT